MHRLSRLLLVTSILLNGFLIFKFINHHYINLDDVQYVETRLDVYVQTQKCGRNFNKIQKVFPQAIAMADEPCTEKEHVFKSYIEAIDKNQKLLKYSYKYLETLKICQGGNKMLCMIVEDDVLFLHKNETTWNNIVLNTMSLFSNDETFWDCSKRNLWLPTASNDVKTLCRIFSSDLLPAFTDCLARYLETIPDTEDKGIHVLLDRCQNDLKITQKRFLLVNHSGQKSLLGN
jgi:hypothetical protein